MARLDDLIRQNGKEPEYTCPLIDATIGAVDKMQSAVDAAYNEIVGRKSLLEQVRAANEGLREWGQAWKGTDEALVQEVEDLKTELRTVKQELDDALSELREAHSHAHV